MDVISETVVIGTGFLSSLSASFADFTGTRSNIYANKLQEGKEFALKKLKEKARSMGGNAIIGIDIDYTTFTADVMGIIVNGTLVKIEKQATQKYLCKLPQMAFNENLPFNISTLMLQQDIVSKKCIGSLKINMFMTDQIIQAAVVDIELKDILGNVKVIPNIIFTSDSLENMHCTSFLLDGVQLELISQTNVIVKKYIFEDINEIVEVDSAKYNKNETISIEKIKKMRSILGDDVTCDCLIEEDKWLCYCGATNKIENSGCYRCGRKSEDVRRKTNIYKEFAPAILDDLRMMESAKEMSDYLQLNYIPEILPLLEKINIIAQNERLYGKMKKSAIKFIDEFESGL